MTKLCKKSKVTKQLIPRINRNPNSTAKSNIMLTANSNAHLSSEGWFNHPRPPFPTYSVSRPPKFKKIKSDQSKHEADGVTMQSSSSTESKKERSSKTKDKRDKTDEEKELRKERKLGRKRDRAEEIMLAEKRRREEEKAKLHLQNGEDELGPSHRDKHHHLREKSPPYSGRDHRERSHDRVDRSEKQYITKSSRTRSGY